MTIYDSPVWQMAKRILPQKFRLKIRNPIIKVIVFFKVCFQGSYSANREDVFIEKNLQISGSDTWYLDVGSGHPFIHSNTYKLYKKGAKGVVVDANEFLVDKHRKKRPRDLACVGACFPDFDKQAEVVFYHLDPWELSTTSDIWYQQALSSGAMLVSKKIVPNLLLSDLLKQHYPKNTAQKKILNIDVEGMSYGLLNSIDLNTYPFDLILVERDSDSDLFMAAADTSISTYEKKGSLGPTDIYSKKF